MKNKGKMHLLIVIPFLLVLVLLIGVTYAFYSKTVTTNKNVSITTDKKYIGIYGENKNNIGLNETYTFTIENRGVEDSGYELYLDSTDSSTDLSTVSFLYTRGGATLTGTLGSNHIIDTSFLTTGERETITISLSSSISGFLGKLKIKAINGESASKICKRASSLHSEVCTQSSTESYCSSTNTTYDGTDIQNGDSIIYGNYGKTGNLTTGNALDCDVNKDGIYDPIRERFYYVTDLDSSTAVLIYYNNTVNGVANNIGTIAYDTDEDSYTSGPVTAISYLPKTSQWKNVNLKNDSRNILDENGTVLTSNFSYGGYAARFLTLQELKSSCEAYMNKVDDIFGRGAFDNPTCRFFLENTKYSNNSLTNGYWLEDRRHWVTASWTVSAYGRELHAPYSSTSGSIGVRPVIEVGKTNISY